MKRFLTICAFLVVLVLRKYPQANDVMEDLINASEISDSNQRLEMYDNIIRLYLQNRAASEESISDIGKWMVSEDIDPLDDSKIIYFFLIADSGKGVYDENIYLVIRCTPQRQEVFINWNSYLGSEIYVTTRIGTEQATKKEWSISTDSQASFYPEDAFGLINQLLKVDRFIAQCTPYSENPITAIFDTRGLREAAKIYLAELKWEE